MLLVIVVLLDMFIIVTHNLVHLLIIHAQLANIFKVDLAIIVVIIAFLAALTLVTLAIVDII